MDQNLYVERVAHSDKSTEDYRETTLQRHLSAYWFSAYCPKVAKIISYYIALHYFTFNQNAINKIIKMSCFACKLLWINASENIK